MKATSESLEDTHKIASEILTPLTPSLTGTILALSGDLGAGKTAFAQAVGEIVGVSEMMQSPTFVIEKIYDIDWHGFKHLIHIDAYRLESEVELEHLGWKEIISDPMNLIVIEWPEKVSGLVPSDAKKISFTTVDDHTRHIEYA